MKNSPIRGNINKQARVEISGEAYRLVQIRGNHYKKDSGKMEIWQRDETGSYSHFGYAGEQKAIDQLSINDKRELLRQRIQEILATINEKTA